MTESQTSHRACALAWFRALGASDYPAMKDLMAEEVEFWTSPSVREGGIIGRNEVMDRLERVFSSGRYYEPGSFACQVLGVIAEGDQTAARVVMRGRFPNGNPYENIYLVWQRWQNGQMTYQLELFDAAHWAHQHGA
ncbi:nuclear transport factor 2 family protein [Myxococcota bacterium]|nr:nuclear transport factor 2 family protein [Myxococcota bacterium]